MPGSSYRRWIATVVPLLAGGALFAWLLVHHGGGRIASALAAGGWGKLAVGILAISAYRLVTFIGDALAWRPLFNPSSRPSLWPLVAYRWICESLNGLLPVAQVGGDLARARLAMRRGVSGAEAGAVVLVDFTIGILTQLLYSFLGVALFLARGGGPAARGIALGLLLASVPIALFTLVGWLNPFRRLSAFFRFFLPWRSWSALAGNAAALDRSLREVYRRRRDVLLSAAWRMASWILHTGETWLALLALGKTVGFQDALILESLSYAARSLAFLIPGGLGVQEGSFLLLGGPLGLTPEVSLALALVKRAREIVLGCPGVVAYAVIEGRGLARRLSRETARTDAQNSRGDRPT